MPTHLSPSSSHALAVATPITPALSPHGFLVVIGGGTLTPSILQKTVELAGKEQARLVIMPMASESPAEIAFLQKQQFAALGATQVEILDCTRETADDEKNLALIDQATGVFLCGGDQRKLTSTLLGTQLLARMYQLYQSGGTLAGTSAGAAVMSKIMLTGESRLPWDPALPYPSIQAQNIQIASGFGFMESAIIDQHFSKRGRHNRLLSLVLEHPQLIGIGIDESTAIVVSPDHMLEVVGDSHILLFDASSAYHIHVDSQQNMSASHVLLHILCAGDRYDLAERKIYSNPANTANSQQRPAV